MPVKIIALLRARAGMSRAEFLRHWQQDHPAVVWALPGLRAYQQTPAIEHRKPWPWDAMAELWFDSVDDIRTAFSSPAAKPMHDHEEVFLADVQWFIADDTTVVPPPGLWSPTARAIHADPRHGDLAIHAREGSDRPGSGRSQVQPGWSKRPLVHVR